MKLDSRVQVSALVICWVVLAALPAYKGLPPPFVEGHLPTFGPTSRSWSEGM